MRAAATAASISGGVDTRTRWMTAPVAGFVSTIWPCSIFTPWTIVSCARSAFAGGSSESRLGITFGGHGCVQAMRCVLRYGPAAFACCDTSSALLRSVTVSCFWQCFLGSTAKTQSQSRFHRHAVAAPQEAGSGGPQAQFVAIRDRHTREGRGYRHALPVLPLRVGIGRQRQSKRHSAATRMVTVMRKAQTAAKSLSTSQQVCKNTYTEDPKRAGSAYHDFSAPSIVAWKILTGRLVRTSLVTPPKVAVTNPKIAAQRGSTSFTRAFSAPMTQKAPMPSASAKQRSSWSSRQPRFVSNLGHVKKRYELM